MNLLTAPHIPWVGGEETVHVSQTGSTGTTVVSLTPQQILSVLGANVTQETVPSTDVPGTAQETACSSNVAGTSEETASATRTTGGEYKPLSRN